jgi:DNA polymerase (family 10)
VTNADIAAALEQIARLSDLLGEDTFRGVAHSRAARAIEASADDFVAMAKATDASAQLTAVKGIGPALAKKIIELATTGKIAELDKMQAQVPPGLLPLSNIQGLGPKTIRTFWQEAGVTDAASLKKALDDGTIEKLPRMSARTVEKLKAAIAVASETGSRIPLGQASAVARRIIDRLGKVKGVQKIEAAGSLRRGKETVGDIDMVVATTDPAAVTEAFRTMPDVRQVLSGGEHRSSVRVGVKLSSRWDDGPESVESPSGPSIQVDLRACPPAQFGSMMCYFSGSKEHVVTTRQMALERGWTLNEWGLFPNDKHPTPPQDRGVKPLASKTEEEIYARLGLPWIPPELRENTTEFTLKETPRLIEIGDIKAELHAHTKASDGSMTILQLAKLAKARGYHTIAVTDHSQSSALAGGLKPDRLREHIKAIRAAQQEIDGITILAGSEVDIKPNGTLDYDDELLAELDIVVASPHASLSQDSAAATERMVKAASHPLVRILGHPTGRLVLRRRGIEPDMPAVIAAARANNVALEINAHWHRLDLRDTHVKMAIDAGCLISINCDTHHESDLDNLQYGIATARRGWVTPERCINTWPAAKLRKWLKR